MSYPPQTKRFKPGPVVDLTLDSDSSDDDIVITGFKQIRKPQPGPANRTSVSANATPFPAKRPSAPPTVPLTPINSSPSNMMFQPIQPHNANQVQLLPANQMHAHGLPSPVVKRESVGLKHENVDGLDGLRVHGNGSIEYQGHFFNTPQQLAARITELETRVKKYQQGVDAYALREKSRPAKQVELKNKRDSLLRLGISETDTKVMQLSAEMKKLSDDARIIHQKQKEFITGLSKSRRKLQSFLNNAKPRISKLIETKVARERLVEQDRLLKQRERVDAMRRQQQQQQHLALARAQAQRAAQAQQRGGLAGVADGAYNVFHAAVGQMRAAMNLNSDDEDYSEDEGVHYRGFGGDHYERLVQEQLRKDRERERLMHNPTSLNAYNTDDLMHLLESVKKQEEQEIEGESNTPEDLTVNLLKHQRIGLKWMEDTEDDDKKRGGILADAMGLGKTVQMIALMSSHRAKDIDPESVVADTFEAKVQPYGKVNLIVAPVSLINQWQSEIQTKVKESANIRIFMYHSLGSSKRPSFQELSKYDVVMTSYGTLAAELKKHCNFPGFEDNYKLNSALNLRSVNAMKDGRNYISPLFSEESKFYRVILDESQQIKNRSTKVSVACSTVESYYRWCLSGTPMQNGVDELFPLLRFLKIKPYNVWERFTSEILKPLKGIGAEDEDGFYMESAMNKLRFLLRSVMLRREKDSLIDGKPILNLPEKNVVKENILLDTNKSEESFYRSIELQSQQKVESLLSKTIARGDYSYIFTMLLRLRQACLHSELVRIGDRRLGVVYDEDGNVVTTANVDSMCRNADKLKPEVVRRVNDQAADENGFDCPICLETGLEPERYTMFSPCGHGLCKECVASYFEEFQEKLVGNVRVAKCVTCRLDVKETEVVDYSVFDKRVNHRQSPEMIKLVYEKNIKEQKKVMDDLKVDKLEFSPKIAGVIKLLKSIWSKNPDDKIIIFSHFTSFFMILKKFLDREQIRSLQYVGSMNAIQRNEMVKEFYRNDDYKLMLISLKAGNSGLTLTCANHVIIMDPFWNPYVEAQAQDRCHRIGQTKPVTVYRMLIQDTIEDRILDLQKKKQDLIESAMDPTGMKQVSKLSREDIANLFNIRLPGRN